MARNLRRQNVDWPGDPGIAGDATPATGLDLNDFANGDGHARALQRRLAERFAADSPQADVPSLGMRARLTIIAGAAIGLWLLIGVAAFAVIG